MIKEISILNIKKEIGTLKAVFLLDNKIFIPYVQ